MGESIQKAALHHHHQSKLVNNANDCEIQSSAVLLDASRVKQILKENGNLPCQALPKKHGLRSNGHGTTALEASLMDHTDIDNMDEDNKFICKACSTEEGLLTCMFVCMFACVCMCMYVWYRCNWSHTLTRWNFALHSTILKHQ